MKEPSSGCSLSAQRWETTCCSSRRRSHSASLTGGWQLVGEVQPHPVNPPLLSFSLSVMSDSVTPWTAAREAPLSSTISQSLLRYMSIESVMPSEHIILCRHFLLLPSIFPSIMVFSNESAFQIRWPQY